MTATATPIPDNPGDEMALNFFPDAMGKIRARMLSEIGLAPIERMVRQIGGYKMLPVGAMENMSPQAEANKHSAGIGKTLPGILAAAGRLGERPLGGNTGFPSIRPLMKRGS